MHTNMALHWKPDDTALQEAVNFLLKIKYEDHTVFFSIKDLKIRECRCEERPVRVSWGEFQVP